MKKYLAEVHAMLKGFVTWELIQIPRGENGRADLLLKIAASLVDCRSRSVTLMDMTRSSLDQMLEIEEQKDWRSPLIQWLQEPVAGKDIRDDPVGRRALRFYLQNGILYKRSYMGPHLRCVSEQDGEYVLKEVHEGCCGDDIKARILVGKVLRAGYFWPTMKTMAQDLVRKSKKCQQHGPLIHRSADSMVPISSALPFTQWGIDIVGPLPQATGQRKFLIMAVDYFSKWIEAEPLATITEERGSAYDELVRGDGLEGALGAWVDELDSVLWSYRTTPRTSTGETQFSLVYGMEAVILVEVGLNSERVSTYTEEGNVELRMEALDLVDKLRDQARLRTTVYKQRMKAAHDKLIRARCFQVGDLVWRQADALKHVGKLEPNWKGPYTVDRVFARGAYELRDAAGRLLPRPWNISHLKKYYA
ncbi:pol polyprotein [Striga asiatica]|uniref:Pol polyprotein n=1 Tax=Striga asiatica TaxID=4170 RepID=A0A5A7QKP3_STRAF|nr:pol polyprotein [Striga asiatica]